MTAKKPKIYTYRWVYDYPAVINDRTTPTGEGVLAVPGKNFQTTEPVDHPYAVPRDKPEEDEGEQTQEAGQEAPDQEGPL